MSRPRTRPEPEPRPDPPPPIIRRPAVVLDAGMPLSGCYRVLNTEPNEFWWGLSVAGPKLFRAGHRVAWRIFATDIEATGSWWRGYVVRADNRAMLAEFMRLSLAEVADAPRFPVTVPILENVDPEGDEPVWRAGADL